MRTTTYGCDNCGRTINFDQGEGFYNVSVQGFGPARVGPAGGNGAHSDLCAECLDTLPPVVRHGRKQATS